MTHPSFRRACRLVPILLLAAPILRAQAPLAGTGEETVTLSPFVVASEGDDGYSAKQTVSATHLATNLADLPLSISIVTDQFLNDLGAVDVGQALLYENVTVPSTDIFTSNISTSYIVRGFTAATMRNGFLSAGGSTPVSRIAIDRVEVVKGPSSLLYGEMDPGGLVNVVSKKPSTTESTNAEVWAGTYRDRGGSFDATGPIDKAGRFAYRLMGMDDDTESLYVGTHAIRKELVGMLAGKLTATTDLNIEYDYVRNHVDAPGGEAFFVALFTDPLGRGSVRQYLLPGNGAPPANFNYRGPGDYGDGLERYLNAELHQKLGSWNLRLAFSNIWDNTGSISRNTSALLSASSTLSDTYKHGVNVLAGVQGDITNSWNLGSEAEWKFLAGFDATRGHSMFMSGTSPITETKINPLNPATFPQPWPIPAPAVTTFTTATTNSRGRYEDGAVYTTNLLDLFQKRVHLLGGMRAQRTTATALNYLSKTQGEFSLNNVSYQAGGLVDITPELGLYASWSQSFNPQNVLLRDPKPVDASGNPIVGAVNDTRPAQPIQGEGHDIGFKWSLLKGRVDVTGAYYDVRRSNEIQTRTLVDASGNPQDIYDVQSGAEWSQGVEFGLTGKLLPNVDIMINYNQPFSGKLLADAALPVYAGKQLQNNPHQQLSFFTKYTFSATSWLNGFAAGFGGRYWGKSQSFLPTQPQLAELPPYFIADAVVEYRRKLGPVHTFGQLNASNALDRHVLYNAYSYSGGTSYRVTLGAKF